MSRDWPGSSIRTSSTSEPTDRFLDMSLFLSLGPRFRLHVGPQYGLAPNLKVEFIRFTYIDRGFLARMVLVT